MSLSHFWHGVIHVALGAGQVINAASAFIPPPYNLYVAGGLAAIQGGLAAYFKYKASQVPVAVTPQ